MSASAAIAATQTVLALTSVAMEAMIQVQKIQALLANAQAEGREINDLEWKMLNDDLEAAAKRAHDAAGSP